MSGQARIPADLKDGDWWQTTHLTEAECWNCGKVFHDRPAVMRYKKELDHGGDQARVNPAWARDGWLVWWECEHCGAGEGEMPRQTATDAVVLDWTEKIGPWKELR